MTAAAARKPPAPAPRAHPIIFTGAMVRALQAGQKTQTRRLVRDIDGAQIDSWRTDGHGSWYGYSAAESSGGLGVPVTDVIKCPYGVPGDRLWVREGYHIDVDTLAEARAVHEDAMASMPVLFYRADKVNKNAGCRWRPAIFMPRWASRLLLELTDVRVQRLNELTREDAIAEGCPRTVGYDVDGGPEHWFRIGWNDMHGDHAPWSSNPWVWALTFNVVEGLTNA